MKNQKYLLLSKSHHAIDQEGSSVPHIIIGYCQCYSSCWVTDLLWTASSQITTGDFLLIMKA